MPVLNKGAGPLTALLRGDKRPTPEQEERLLAFLKNKYGDDVTLAWEQGNKKGFTIEIGPDTYDWTVEGRMGQLRSTLLKSDAQTPTDVSKVIPLLKSRLEDWKLLPVAQEYGKVKTIGDGIAVLSGLENAEYGEILEFSSGVRGLVQDLRTDEVGCILFGDESGIHENSHAYRTGKTAGIPVGEEFIGRVIDPLGTPIDGRGPIHAADYRPIESPAPGIIDRQPVDTPMETGLLSIDAMFPIGRGQRELIIGDRQTGKTAIALDTMINQKGKDVICIYVAIGQKASSVAQMVETLRSHGAMDYSIIVCATASDTAPVQYIAPYAGCAMGEYFMHQGKDVLIIYDDLSKHAIAYRTMSLLLGRPPGREAYPGDVFYLHSRLLERAARLSDELGGGSITALPIVETQAGDVSAYIPTNIISITDGQIYLESNLFHSGQRPAVNVGLSVSRVGGDAQTKAVKKATGSMKLDLEQYREMEVFTQFSSDLDDTTKRQLAYGAGLMRLLRQPQYHPLTQHQQVIVLVAALNHVMQDVPLDKMNDFKLSLISYVETHSAEACDAINTTGQLAPETVDSILKSSRAYLDIFMKTVK